MTSNTPSLITKVLLLEQPVVPRSKIYNTLVNKSLRREALANTTDGVAQNAEKEKAPPERMVTRRVRYQGRYFPESYTYACLATLIDSSKEAVRVRQQGGILRPELYAVRGQRRRGLAPR